MWNLISFGLYYGLGISLALVYDFVIKMEFPRLRPWFRKFVSIMVAVLFFFLTENF